MPNTYSQIYIHYVFAVHSRDTSLDVQWRESLYQYIGGIVRKRIIGNLYEVHLGIIHINPPIAATRQSGATFPKPLYGLHVDKVFRV